MDEVDQMLSFLWDLIKIIAGSAFEALKISIESISKVIPLALNSLKKK